MNQTEEVPAVTAWSSQYSIPRLDDLINDTNAHQHNNNVNNNFTSQKEYQEYLISSQFTKVNFVKFLMKNVCLENLEVYIELERLIEQMQTYEQPDETTMKSILNDWWFLYNTYIDSNSPKEINLPCEIRTELENNKNLPNLQTLTKFSKFIKNYLHSSYVDFTNYIMNEHVLENLETQQKPSCLSNNNDQLLTPTSIGSPDGNRCVSPLSIENPSSTMSTSNSNNIFPRSNEFTYNSQSQQQQTTTSASNANTRSVSNSSISYSFSNSLANPLNYSNIQFDKLIGKKLKFRRRSSNTSNSSNDSN